MTQGQRIHALQFIIDNKYFSMADRKKAKEELMRMLGLLQEKEKDAEIVPFIYAPTTR